MRMVISAIVALLLFLGAASRNITPDAVTRATIWNSHEGDPDVLGDGKVPQDADALPFTWKTKGILVFAWEEPLQLEKLRIYVGAIGNDYQVRTYLGGRLDETGTLREPEGVQTALIEENARAVGQWIEIYFPPDTMADNLELWTLGPYGLLRGGDLRAQSRRYRNREIELGKNQDRPRITFNTASNTVTI